MERVRVWIAPAADPDSRPVEVWGLSPTERLRRCLRAAGVADADVACGADPPLVESGTAMLAFRGDYVFDERVVRVLVERHAGRHADTSRSLSLIDPQTPSRVVAAYGPAATRTIASPAGPAAVRPDDVIAPYSSALRKSASAFVLPVRSDTRTRVENHLFHAAYKGVTDAVTKWVWPRPARAVTRLLARGHVSPNVVTGASWLLVGVATWLFVRGQYGAGLACAWLMTFLDTVDGKLARVTCTSSRIGHVLDHSLDLVHPPFWYLAWAMGLAGSCSFGLLWSDPTTALIVGGYVLGRLLEGAFLLAFGMEIHSWRPIDSAFRTMTARRNPNLILLTLGTAAGWPDLGFHAVAVWTVASLAFHAVRLGQAGVERLRGRSIRTWQAMQDGE